LFVELFFETVEFVIVVWVQYVSAWNSAEFLHGLQVLFCVNDAWPGASGCRTRRQKYDIVICVFEQFKTKHYIGWHNVNMGLLSR